ncbi:Outer membrane protein TolC [Propionispira arboris]|uniref:Outer membrane protein TolC n=1 Tax=Propionispira arboris TaxID=84035 RepID=A0A1H6U926_9FIRM|nr:MULTISPECIES: TolC family protein [Propionispira]SEI88036.1 Outer membrane protein TolC [Propionispira arboris]
MMRKSCLKRVVLLFAGCFLWNISLGACAALSLDEAVAMALNQNPQIKIAAKGEEKAAANLNAAKGANGFSISASSKFSISDGADQIYTNGNSNGITASMPLYTGGKNELNIDSKKDAITTSELNTARTQENIVLDTIKAYYDILEAKKTVDVDQESVDNYQAHLTNVQQLYAAGSKARVEVLRSDVELSNARQTLIKAQNSYDIAVSTLKNIIKMDRDEPLSLTDDFSYRVFDKDLYSCLDYAMVNRKDLQAAKLAVSVAERDIDIAAADKKPQVDVSVSTSWDKQVLPSSSDYNYTAGVSASWNLFDSNVTNSNIKAAKVAVEEATLELEKEQDDVDLAVRQAYLNMKEAEKRFTSTANAIKQAQEDNYIANEKYKAGEGLMLDIIDAQLALSTAQLNYISAQYDYARYKATLENVMGLRDGVTK